MRILMIANWLKPLLFVSFCFCPISATPAEDPYQVEWHQGLDVGYGVGYSPYNYSIASDTLNNIYISGTTGENAYLMKINADGNEIWTQQLGTSAWDLGLSIATNSLGDVFLSGLTYGSFNGANSGDADSFLSKFDANGNEIWTKQYGSNEYDNGQSVTADSLGNVYVSGWTEGSIQGVNAGQSDLYVTKFDSNGNQLWTQQIGTSESDQSNSIAIDASGNSYITGWTDGVIQGPGGGGRDAFVLKLDSNGNQLWTQQIGTSESDQSNSIAVDVSGNSYITGQTNGVIQGLGGGGADAFIMKLDSNGNQLWAQQFDGNSIEIGESVTIDGSGNPYIAGWTGGNLEGENAGGSDAFLIKLDNDGNRIWTEQIGTDGAEGSIALTIDIQGNPYIAGHTKQITTQFVVFGYPFVTKFSPLPTPGDFNRDGIVNAADYTTWRDGLGTIYDIADYNEWVANYSDTAAPAEPTSNSVPEPTALLLLVAGICFLTRHYER